MNSETDVLLNNLHRYYMLRSAQLNYPILNYNSFVEIFIKYLEYKQTTLFNFYNNLK